MRTNFAIACIRPDLDEVAISLNRHPEWEYDNIQYDTLEEAMEKQICSLKKVQNSEKRPISVFFLLYWI
jgi:hypothetical protein